MHNLFARTGSFDFKRSRYLIHVKSGRQQCAPRRMAFSIFEQMLGVGHKEGGGADSRSRSFFRSPRRTILSLFIRGRWRGNFRSPSLSLFLSMTMPAQKSVGPPLNCQKFGPSKYLDRRLCCVGGATNMRFMARCRDIIIDYF